MKEKTLEMLENDYWGDPSSDLSRLVRTCYRLRKKPINNLTIEDQRVLLSQRIGIKHILPLTIRSLRENILSEGDFYPGDLLLATLLLDDVYWKKNINQKNELNEIILLNIDKFQDTEISKEIKNEISNAIDKFTKKNNETL